MRRLGREWGAVVVLLALFLGSWAGHAAAQAAEVAEEAAEHGGRADAGDLLVAFSRSTLENWQSEFLQLLVQALLLLVWSSRLFRRGERAEEETIRRAVAAVLDEREDERERRGS